MGSGPASLPVEEGQILDGKYRIDRLIGSGSMGIVVSAWHLDLEKRVAIKFLHPEIAAREDAVGRLLREARAVGRINSEHVARVFDVGRTARGEPYIVMEHLAGRDMSLALLEQGPLAVADAVGYVQQVCEALAEAHAAGVIHRDLKPANLFLDARDDGPRIKVLDFGISKVPITKDGAALLTNAAVVMGSPAYMSPEQLRSTRDVDEKTDIWALGVILYEMLTGKLPFDAETLPLMCTMILLSPPPTPRSLRADLPVGLEAIILRCLEKVAAQRFAHVAQLSAALVPFGAEGAALSAARAARARGLSPRWGITTSLEPIVDLTEVVAFRPRRSRALVLGALLLGLCVLLFVGVRRMSAPSDATSVSDAAGGTPTAAGVSLADTTGSRADTLAGDKRDPADVHSASSAEPSPLLPVRAGVGRTEGSGTPGHAKRNGKARIEGATQPPGTRATPPEPLVPARADDFGGRK